MVGDSRKRAIGWLGAAVVVLAMALPGDAGAAGGPLSLGGCLNYMGIEATTQPGSFGRLPDEVVDVTSTLDGRPLEVGIVRPKGPAGYRAPVVLWASAYIQTPLSKVALADCAPWLVKNFVQHGYAVALFPTRGTGNTDGCPNLFGTVERSDLDDVVNYLGTRAWSNGKVAMYGLSYDGSTPWVAASSGNPHLKTIIPAEGVNDLFDLAYGAGTLDWRWEIFVYGYYLQYGPEENNPAYSGRDLDRTINALTTCPDFAQGMEATFESALTSQLDHFGYWAERNQRPLVERRYRGSVLLLQGLQDWNVRPGHTIPWTVSLRRHGIYVRQILGQWMHAAPDAPEVGRNARFDFADIMLAWLGRWLKGDQSAGIGPRVEVEDDTGHWRRADRWPAPNSTHLALTADRRITRAPGAPTATALLGPDSRSRYYYTADGFPNSDTNDADLPVPAGVDQLCATCVAFTTTVSEATRIAGLPEVHIQVTPTAPAGHVTAVLYRKGPDGLHRLGWGQTDLRFPAGENRPMAKPAPLVPGRPLELRIEFEPLDVLVPKGDQLVLILGEGNSSQLSGRPPAPLLLRYGGDLSRLDLPVVHPAASSFFTPPAKPVRLLGS
jgi:X-Pro dipeptidyl-peptidase